MFPVADITDQEYANQKITEIQAIMRGPGITPENLRFFLLAAIERGKEQERIRCKNIVESKWDQWYHNRRSCGVCGIYLEFALDDIRQDGKTFDDESYRPPRSNQT